MKELCGQKIISTGKMNLEFQKILKKLHVTKILIVADATYEKSDLKNWFENMPFQYAEFNTFSIIPTYEEICMGVKLFLREQCDAVIAIGGSSAIITAKGIKMFAALDQEEDYLNQVIVSSQVPCICIPTMTGAGCEANGSVIFMLNGRRECRKHESCRPSYLYYEPKLLDLLSDYEKRSSLAEAMMHCVDMMWAVDATEESITYAEKAFHLLYDNTMQYLRGEESSYSRMQLGTFYVGKALENRKGTAVQDMAFWFAEKCKIAQGQAGMMLVPSVYQMLVEKFSEEQESFILQEKLDRIRDMIYPGANKKSDVKKQFEFLLRILKFQVPEYIGEEEVSILSKQVEEDRIEEYPICILPEDVGDIFTSAFRMIRDEENNLIQDPSYVKVVQRQEFVDGLQKLTLETLLLTQKFLDEYGLTFFLGEGTLLGAVRHHGFILWDDDVDILMPRDDYDQLVELAKAGKVPPELNFDALENNDKHWVLGAKMQLVRETDYVQEKVKSLSKCHGPYVDIFPLDYWPKPFGFKLRISDMKVKVCRRMLFMKTGYSKATKKKFHRRVLRVMCFFVTNRQIENWAIKNMKKFQDKKRKYMVNLCSYYPFYKEVFPSACFKEKVMIDFEGHPMPLPKDYDYVLKTTYGAKYDSIPPYVVTKMRKHAFSYRNEQVQRENV